MINFALNDKQDQIRVLGTELIVIIIEQDVSLVNSIDHEETTTTIDNSDPPILEELVHNNKSYTTRNSRRRRRRYTINYTKRR